VCVCVGNPHMTMRMFVCVYMFVDDNKQCHLYISNIFLKASAEMTN